MSMRNRFFSKVMAAVLICAAFVPLNIALAEEKEQAGPDITAEAAVIYAGDTAIRHISRICFIYTIDDRFSAKSENSPCP